LSPRSTAGSAKDASLALACGTITAAPGDGAGDGKTEDVREDDGCLVFGILIRSLGKVNAIFFNPARKPWELISRGTI